MKKLTEVPKEYPYRLLVKWQAYETDLKPFLELFQKYQEEDSAVIVEASKGWNIFTTGKLAVLSVEKLMLSRRNFLREKGE